MYYTHAFFSRREQARVCGSRHKRFRTLSYAAVSSYMPSSPSATALLSFSLTDARIAARTWEMWGDVGRCGQMWGDVGRCGEM